MILLALVLLLAGCAAPQHHPPMFCQPVRVDGRPILGCVDANDVEFHTVEPYGTEHTSR